MDLIDDPAVGENAPEFTVSEISGAVKKTLEGAFGRVRIRGELGRVVIARSGHIYFDIKDDERKRAAIKSEKAKLINLMLKDKMGGGKTQLPKKRKDRNFHCDTKEI